MGTSRSARVVRFFFGRFRSVYRARLEDVLNRLFTPERIQQRVDEIATAIRGPISAESKFRLEKFQQSVGTRPVTHSPEEQEFSLNQPAYPYKICRTPRALDSTATRRKNERLNHPAPFRKIWNVGSALVTQRFFGSGKRCVRGANARIRKACADTRFRVGED